MIKASIGGWLKMVIVMVVCGLLGFIIGYSIVRYTGHLTPEQKAVQHGAQPSL